LNSIEKAGTNSAEPCKKAKSAKPFEASAKKGLINANRNEPGQVEAA
jgi:hypothetical protein